MTINAHLDYVTAVHFNRDSTMIVTCSVDGLMCVLDDRPLSPSDNTLQTIMGHEKRPMPQNSCRIQQRHLVRACSSPTPNRFVHADAIASTYNSPQMANTSSPLHMIAPSGYGTTKPVDASRRTWDIPTPSSASLRASALPVGNGSLLVVRTRRSIYGICRAGRSCRRLKRMVVSGVTYTVYHCFFLKLEQPDVVVSVATHPSLNMIASVSMGSDLSVRIWAESVVSSDVVDPV